MDLSAYFANLAALVPLIVLVTGFVTNQFKLKGNAAQVVSWVAGPVLAFIGFFFGLGMFAAIGPVWTGVYGVSAALLANGLVSNDTVAFMLELLKLKVPKDK